MDVVASGALSHAAIAAVLNRREIEEEAPAALSGLATSLFSR